MNQMIVQIKSITRTIELDPYFSSGLRFLVLECMSFRMVSSLNSVFASEFPGARSIPNNRCAHESEEIVAVTYPTHRVLVSLSLISTVTFSFLDHSTPFRVWRKQQWVLSDLCFFHVFLVSIFHPYAYIFVGIFTFMEMLLDLFLDALDGRFVLVSNQWASLLTAVFFRFKRLDFTSKVPCFLHLLPASHKLF